MQPPFPLLPSVNFLSLTSERSLDRYLCVYLFVVILMCTATVDAFRHYFTRPVVSWGPVRYYHFSLVVQSEKTSFAMFDRLLFEQIVVNFVTGRLGVF